VWAGQTHRIGAIDELRGLALCAVVLSHIGLVYGLDTPLAYGLALPAFGVGVDLFFVISGFVISRNVAAMKIKAGGDARAGALAFWMRRFIRIALPAWATAAAIGVVRLASGAANRSSGDLIAGAGFYANFYWTACFEGNTPCPDALIASHFWSLALEMQFYALTPLLAALAPRRALAAGAIVLALCAVLQRPVGGFWWSIRPDALLIGMALASQAAQRAAWLRNALPRVSLGQSIYWVVVVAVFARLASVASSGLVLLVAALIFGVIVAGRIKAGAAAGWAAAALRKGGEASFSAYLVHLPILTGVHAILREAAAPMISLAAALAAVVVATILWERAIVKPAAKLGRRLSDALIIINCKSVSSGRI
jgi:peptidoglycan/LPS O-acetylase OafA/YrhL